MQEQELVTVLVVDDEPEVRDFLEAVLTDARFNVVKAAGAREAFQIYVENGDQIHLVLLDLLMPEISGHSLIQSLVRKNPAIKIIVVSGATPELHSNDAMLAGAHAVVIKPFSPQALIRKIREVLEY